MKNQIFVQKIAILFSLVFLLLPFRLWAEKIYLDASGVKSVTVTSDDGELNIESNGPGRISFATGAARTALLRRIHKYDPKNCENLNVVSIRDGSNRLLGTATRISKSLYVTARHVLAGKNPVILNTKEDQVFKVNDFFKKFYQVVNKRTGRPLDLLFISSTNELDTNNISNQLVSLLKTSPISLGSKWSSCQFSMHENDILSQYSEGEVKLTSDDHNYFFLEVSSSTDLPTFGSSGASVWIENFGLPALAGIVSCLQTFQDSVSGSISYFPKILAIAEVINSTEFSFEEITLEKLIQKSQENNPHCIF